MTIVVDENIPYAQDALSAFGEVRLMSGRAITREKLADAEILIVRSITRVDSALLEGTPVCFVGTATNGIDHIDTQYLYDAGITFAAAGGSNANSVAEYVLAALFELRSRGCTPIAGARLGIIGAGAIGSLMLRAAPALGLDVVPYDPPKALINPAFHSAAFDDLFACDILTFHVPLTDGGDHPTRAMVNAAFLARLRPGTILVNTSRGDVVDSGALLAALKAGTLGAAAFDVWEGEPSIPVELVESLALATPHIAGYSIDAKLRGTEMMAEALAQFCGIVPTWSAASALPDRAGRIELAPGMLPLDAAAAAIRTAYDITRDDGDIRALFPLSDSTRRAGFDLLRKNYRVRREFRAFSFASDDIATRDLLTSLGFSGNSRGAA